jgi:hypothetical protein
MNKEYEVTKEVVNKQLMIASKFVSDVDEHVNHIVIVGHDELYICLCTTFFLVNMTHEFCLLQCLVNTHY